ncbi:MAG TPA: desulfoferrodoxin family protein [Clostridia bacterium]|jgi:superoxide reductase|nr:desulfoferrodoxin family protein [Clostridia bacterium]HOL61104.1 desulfoferrodoxin family protein [Clostridia bacterium]HPO53762.1 desulfoferrodoxin family protein [Clostridia bacterium]
MSNNSSRFYICKICGNLVGKIHDSGVTMVCCGQPMTELVANTVEASYEKHLPVISVDGSTVTVKVGSVPHPMLPEHYIDFVYLETEKGGQRKILGPNNVPEATFELTPDDKAVAAYEYCNLHGLWKTSL